MLHQHDFPSEHQKKQREGSELVDPRSLLEIHPLLNFWGVVDASLLVKVDNHDTSVEMAGVVVGEGEGERGVGPEGRGEVGVAVLQDGEDNAVIEGSGRELGDVLNKDEVK
ncbi:hypothetical protein D8674_036867 [Pyrus ussuriensis x Pyrus communis]|uniref:Uncharacterized protein n=1 Tax=Pyrus ussuriensis x Pyrus communis TaxID=2448454 RepID=A0A5N5GAK0_9ROSA|nr:hypothetical protein D8674_036867 [Pyrus ussuriensis x Pyrus communis]